MPSSPFGHPHARSKCYATWFIRLQAWKLAGKYGFAADESADIRQELTLHLLKQWSNYDETKSEPTTFIATVINSKVRDMLRVQRAQLREEPLDDFLEEELDEGILDGIRGQPDISEFEQIDLRIDCEQVLSGLPPDLQEIAHLLKEMSVAAAARELGIPKTTLWRRVDVLKSHFEAAGFGRDLPFTENQAKEQE